MSEAEHSHNIEFLAATHIPGLFEQREMLMRAVEALLLADRTGDSRLTEKAARPSLKYNG
jgi:hypothetical protein